MLALILVVQITTGELGGVTGLDQTLQTQIGADSVYAYGSFLSALITPGGYFATFGSGYTQINGQPQEDIKINLSFVFAPIPPLPRFQLFQTIPEPFTMTGQLIWLGQTTDLAGEGMVTFGLVGPNFREFADFLFMPDPPAAAQATAVPEPGTLPLLLVGMILSQVGKHFTSGGKRLQYSR